MVIRPAPGLAGVVAMLIAVAVAVAVAVAGCGSSSSSSSQVARDPHRIVSLSPASTEDLFAIGAGPEVVAVDGQSDYPPTAPRTKLSGFQPSVEAIAGYHPDLVVISDESPAYLAPALRKLGIPVVLNPAARTLEQAYAQIARLGASTGHAAQARALVTGIQAEIARLVRSAAGTGRGLSVYDEISPNFYAATSRTFAGQLLRLFGLRNVADRVPDVEGLGYPQLSAEYLLAANPDIVLLSDTICCAQTAAVVARRPGWSQVTAVRHHTIVPINDDIASRWGPRMVDLAAAIAHAVDSAHAAGLAP